MAVFTIKAPDGRQIQIRANDQATALRGAQEWAAANPAQRPGNVAQPSQAFDGAMDAASLASQRLAAPEPAGPDLMGATAATLSGMVNNGLPVVGPLVQKASDALIAGGGMAVDQMTGTQGPDMGGRMQALEDRRSQLDQANPIANIAGGVAGGIGAYNAASKVPALAGALGLTGNLGSRVAASGASTLGIDRKSVV